MDKVAQSLADLLEAESSVGDFRVSPLLHAVFQRLSGTKYTKFWRAVRMHSPSFAYHYLDYFLHHRPKHLDMEMGMGLNINQCVFEDLALCRMECPLQCAVILKTLMKNHRALIMKNRNQVLRLLVSSLTPKEVS